MLSSYNLEVGDLEFRIATREDARQIEQMRTLSSLDLTRMLGPGHWSGPSRIQSIRERIDSPDPVRLQKRTLYVATRFAQAVGSVGVTTFPPGFWKRTLWSEGNETGLGVFALVVFPQLTGQGIGSFLMRNVEGLAKDRQIRYVRLDAYADNPISQSFYERAGYENRGTVNVRGVELVLFEKCVIPSPTQTAN